MKTFYKTILLLSLIYPFLVFNCFGQGESNIWYFGYHAGLDFSSGSPVAIPNGQTYQWEGVATISDTAGNLLFYTDGFSVWNQNHIVMPNGTVLGGNNSSTQSATIVPMPGNATQYYIFTCAEGGNSLGYFRYSLVDMTLAGGMGDVTLKNVALNINSSEKCVTVYKGDATADVWVITHDNDTTFYAYLVTSSGISPPVQSFYSSVNSSYFSGYMKASPQGDRIADAKYGAIMGLALYDFDCTTGIVSNEINISTGGTTYGIEFSPDGSKLYVFAWTVAPTPIYQYDVTLGTAAAIAASQIIVGYSNHSFVGGAQIGPDQKIYLTSDFANSLPVINNPNVQGTGCNFLDNAINLNGNFSGIGLPALIRGSVCSSTAITEIPNDINELRLFPNPSSGIFQITFPSSSKQKANYTLEVINTLGQTVFQSKFQTSNFKLQTNLDLSFLPKGIYVLKINDSVSAISSKFVIE